MNLKLTSIGDARLTFVALSTIALVSVVGSMRLASWMSPTLRHVGLLLWPAVFLVLDLYVIVRFLVPLGGL